MSASEDAVGFAELFRDFGFDDVTVTAVPLPDHLVRWMLREEPDWDVQTMAGEMPYFRVGTRQGAFGVFAAVYPALDLYGTGISFKDLAPERTDAPDDFFLIGLGDDEMLRKFRRLMAERTERPA